MATSLRLCRGNFALKRKLKIASIIYAIIFATELYILNLQEHGLLDAFNIKIGYLFPFTWWSKGPLIKYRLVNSVDLNKGYCVDDRGTCGDATLFDKSSCHSLKSTWNNRMLLDSPEKLAIFNCSRLMTIYNEVNNGRGLGNYMFQAASVIGLASWHGYTPVFSEGNPLSDVFEMINIYDKALFNVEKVSERVCCEQYEQLYHLDNSKNISIDGYLQSWRYFVGAEERVRKAFTFRRTFRSEVGQFLSHVKREGMVIVGIHVRRGDFGSVKNQRRGYTTTPEGYIRRAMQFFYTKFRKIQFIFVSDDIYWCKLHFKEEKITLYSPFTDREHDLALLASCDHVIITSGSFGWWSAWLAGGITVYYSEFPRRGSWLEAQFGKTMNISDYFPEKWIGLS